MWSSRRRARAGEAHARHRSGCLAQKQLRHIRQCTNARASHRASSALAVFFPEKSAPPGEGVGRTEQHVRLFLALLDAARHARVLKQLKGLREAQRACSTSQVAYHTVKVAAYGTIACCGCVRRGLEPVAMLRAMWPSLAFESRASSKRFAKSLRCTY